MTVRFGRRLYDAFFRVVHGEGVGHPRHRDPVAVGRAADQELLALVKAALSISGCGAAMSTTLIEEFQLPAARPRPDVGAHAGEARGAARHPRRARTTASRRSAIATAASTACRARTNGDETEYAVDGVISTIALQRPRPEPRPGAARRRARGGATASLPRLLPRRADDDARPSRSRTTGSTSTTRARAPGASRTSAPGAPTWSRPGTTCLGVEYFCFEGDDIWEMPDEEAVALATEEMARIGLVDPAQVVDGVKVRVPKAYPMYDATLRGRRRDDPRATSRAFENLQTCGRNGLHRYNNQDHSMWTAVLAALNLVDGADHDVWSVNAEEVYLEEGEFLDVLLDARARQLNRLDHRRHRLERAPGRLAAVSRRSSHSETASRCSSTRAPRARTSSASGSRGRASRAPRVRSSRALARRLSTPAPARSSP